LPKIHQLLEYNIAKDSEREDHESLAKEQWMLNRTGNREGARAAAGTVDGVYSRLKKTQAGGRDRPVQDLMERLKLQDGTRRRLRRRGSEKRASVRPTYPTGCLVRSSPLRRLLESGWIDGGLLFGSDDAVWN
jgi:hypothetical protein